MERLGKFREQQVHRFGTSERPVGSDRVFCFKGQNDSIPCRALIRTQYWPDENKWIILGKNFEEKNRAKSEKIYKKNIYFFYTKSEQSTKPVCQVTAIVLLLLTAPLSEQCPPLVRKIPLVGLGRLLHDERAQTQQLQKLIGPVGQAFPHDLQHTGNNVQKVCNHTFQ